MEGKFFCTNDFFSISQMIRNRKGQKLRFLNQMMLSFSHIEKHVLTSHVGKVMKLLFFEDNNRAISETQTVFWFCFYCFSLQCYQSDMGHREVRIVLQKCRYRNLWSECYHYFSWPFLSCIISVTFPSTPYPSSGDVKAQKVLI